MAGHNPAQCGLATRPRPPQRSWLLLPALDQSPHSLGEAGVQREQARRDVRWVPACVRGRGHPLCVRGRGHPLCQGCPSSVRAGCGCPRRCPAEGASAGPAFCSRTSLLRPHVHVSCVPLHPRAPLDPAQHPLNPLSAQVGSCSPARGRSLVLSPGLPLVLSLCSGLASGVLVT